MKKLLILLLSTAVLFSFSGCKNNTVKNNSTTSITEISSDEFDLEFTDNDFCTKLGENTTEVEDDIINITKAGTFKITGNHTQIKVKAPDTAKIQLILENAKINSKDGPALLIESADKVFITIPENTDSSLLDSTEYNTSYDNADGAIFSRCDLTINGKGKLSINANYKCGIVSKDDLVICDTEINITSVGASIEGKDCVKLSNPSITTESGTDAIKSTNNEESNKGFILIENGNYNLVATNDGLQAETLLNIKSGNFNITTGGGSAISSSNNDNWGHWGMGGMRPNENKTTTDTESAKAIKSSNSIIIKNGEFNIDSSDDSVHSNQDIEIKGGKFNITSGDDGIHADNILNILGGDFSVSKSYEGLEATFVNISGGNIQINASDDGINAAGGNDSSAMGGRPGQNGFTANSNGEININGGYILVNASGDGIDSNGKITMNDGVLLINGPENNGNGSFDYDTSATINGGVAVIVGSSGMAQTFSDTSKQCSVSYTLNNTQNSVYVSLSDGENVIASLLPQKSFNHIIISSPDLKIGNKYNLNLGGNVEKTDQNGYTNNSKIENPTEQIEVEISSVSTFYGANFGGIGGDHGGMGGMPKPNRR